MGQLIKNIIKEIQFNTEFNLEQIANKISYSRQHLMKLRDAEDDNESIVKLLNKEFKEILQNVNKNNLNHTLQEKNVSYQTQRLNKKLQGSIINVPVYDIEFTAGFVELVKSGSNIIGFFNFPEFAGCDAVVKCRNNSMLGVINPNDLVGIRKLEDLHDIEIGGVYGIVTKNFALFKYINKVSNEKYLLHSANSDYADREIEITKVIELWAVQTILPYSNLKTLI